MIKKKIKLYYKNIVSKTFENIHGKVFLKKNTSDFLDISQVKDPFFKSYENKKYNIYKVKKARIFTDNNENVAVIKITTPTISVFDAPAPTKANTISSVEIGAANIS